MILLATSSGKRLNSCCIENRHPVKFVAWSDRYKYCAMVSKFNITITDSNLNIIATVAETNNKIKSAQWSDDNVLIYATTNHLKYALINGDNGIIQTLADPMYLVAIQGNKVTTIDREKNVLDFKIDTTEYRFKLALNAGKQDKILSVIQNSRLVGESIIGYLQKKGYPQIALHFVEDQKTKFALALECGDLEKAFACAGELNKTQNEEQAKAAWLKLSQAALEQGDFEKYGSALAKTRSLDKLFFYFTLCGNRMRQDQLINIEKSQGRTMPLFQHSLMTGNVEERVRVLNEAGQTGLAYILAKNHGLSNAMLDVASNLTQEQIEKLDAQCAKSKAELLFPPNAIVTGEGYGDWPCLQRNLEDDVWEEIAKRGYQDPDSEEEGEESEEEEDDDDFDPDVFDAEADDIDIGLGDDKDDDGMFDMDDMGMDFGDDDVDGFDDGELDIDDLGADILPKAAGDYRSKWSSVSDDVAAAVCAGDFHGAMQNYVAQYRISNFAPLKDHFIKCFQSSGAEIPGLPSTPTLSVPILEPAVEDEPMSGRPAVPFTYDSLAKMRNDALRCIDGWKNLDEGLQKFRDVLYASLFTYASQDDATKISKIQKYAETYISAIRVVQQIKKTKGAEQLALRLHLLTYDLHIRDKQMPLFDAIKLANKLEYYLTTSQLCREYFRLLKSSKGKGIKAGFKSLAGKIKKLNQTCEKKNSEAEGLAFDVQATRQEQSVCPLSFQVVKCAVGETFESTFDVDQFAGKFKGKVSPTCNLCKVGARGTRL